jgi:hypothetical protein
MAEPESRKAEKSGGDLGKAKKKVIVKVRQTAAQISAV